MRRCDECPMPPGRDCHPMYCDFLRSGEPTKVAHVRALAARPPPAFPPLTEQAGNLAGAIVTAVASGGKLATPEERERRLAICAGCPEFVAGRCRQCGCVMGWKVKLAAWRCPIDKF